MQSSTAAGGFVQYATVPNLISVVRLIAAPILIVLAAWDLNAAFLGLALVLLMTDWVDGRIARAWNQQTVFGARLDAFSDVAIYLCIGCGVWLLRPDEFWNERFWLIAVIATYLLSLVVCLFKFGCLPNYHTRLAKSCWLLVTVGVVAMLLNFSIWPLRVALAAVTAANVESIAVTLILRRWRPDVNSLSAAWRRSAEAKANPSHRPPVGSEQEIS
jgi:CDP-diacylglycerol--glycerol-3-phosphate 3-phosphatidyltransferase